MDPRQRRTQAKLHAAVLTLAEAGPIAEVTMTQLTAEAGVHRSTLYEHAASPFALLEAALTAELDEIGTGLAEGEEQGASVTEVTRAVLEHVLAHRAIYRRGLGEGSGASSLHPMLSRHFRGSGAVVFATHDWSALTEVTGATAGELSEAAGLFLAEGTVGQIAGWIAGAEPDVDRFLRVYLALAPAWWPGRR